jgi:hypothetical protein
MLLISLEMIPEIVDEYQAILAADDVDAAYAFFAKYRSGRITCFGDFEVLRKAKSHRICCAIYIDVCTSIHLIPRPYSLEMYRIAIFILKSLRLHNTSLYQTHVGDHYILVESLLFTEGYISCDRLNSHLSIDDYYFTLTIGQPTARYIPHNVPDVSSLYLVQIVPRPPLKPVQNYTRYDKIAHELLLYEGTSDDPMFARYGSERQQVIILIHHPLLLLRILLDGTMDQQMIDDLYIEGIRSDSNILDLLRHRATPSETLQRGMKRAAKFYSP